jgi:hypothetical protein
MPRSDQLSIPEEYVGTQRQASQRKEETSMGKSTSPLIIEI